MKKKVEESTKIIFEKIKKKIKKSKNNNKNRKSKIVKKKEKTKKIEKKNEISFIIFWMIYPLDPWAHFRNELFNNDAGFLYLILQHTRNI